MSVSITTYNHEPFIAQAIESALLQETDFDYEILVGEDDSSDRTRFIVQEYQGKHPEKIRLFLHNRRDVITIDGRPTGRRNLVFNLGAARGQYIAWLEGDDYWTSPLKLQRQADFLDRHPECALCFHAVVEHYEDENRDRMPAGPLKKREIYTIQDLFERNFIPSCSVMFRNGLLDELPDWYYTVPMGDWPLHILNAQHGKIGYIDQTMAVYRIHRGGVRSSRDVAYKVRSYVTLLEAVRQHLGAEHRQPLNDNIVRRSLQLATVLARSGRYRKAGKCLIDLATRKDIPLGTVVKAGSRSLFRGLTSPNRRGLSAPSHRTVRPASVPEKPQLANSPDSASDRATSHPTQWRSDSQDNRLEQAEPDVR